MNTDTIDQIIRARRTAFVAPGRARRTAWLGRRNELNAACEACLAEVESTKNHPLYVKLAEHCESISWWDCLIINWQDLQARRAISSGR